MSLAGKPLQQNLAWMHGLSALQAAADKCIGLSLEGCTTAKQPVTIPYAVLPENIQSIATDLQVMPNQLAPSNLVQMRAVPLYQHFSSSSCRLKLICTHGSDMHIDDNANALLLQRWQGWPSSQQPPCHW